MEVISNNSCHDDVMKWEHFPRYWPFVRGIQVFSKQWRRRWFETPSHSSWRHYNVKIAWNMWLIHAYFITQWWYKMIPGAGSVDSFRSCLLTKIWNACNVLFYNVGTLYINSSPPSAAYMRQWIRSALVQIMACRLFGAKPLSKPMLEYYQLDP